MYRRVWRPLAMEIEWSFIALRDTLDRLNVLAQGCRFQIVRRLYDFEPEDPE
jgi:hypothetical protein